MNNESKLFIFVLAVMALLLFHIVCAIVTMNIYESRKRNGGFFWGLFLGGIGILIAWLTVRKKDK